MVRATSPDFESLLVKSGLKTFKIKGQALLPIVQGGMGVGVSAHRLASSVARCGAMAPSPLLI